MKLSVHKLAARIGQEFRKLRKQIADLEVQSQPGPAGPQGPEGPRGPAGANGSTGPAGADGGSFLVWDLPMATAPTNLATGFSVSYILPAPPAVAGKTFTGIRIIRDSRLNLNILATATGAFVAATVIEYPILNVFEVQSTAAGFVPFYVHRRLHLAGAYADGVATGVLSEEFSTEVKLRAADFTPDGIESITLADLGHYIPEYVEDGVLLTYDTGSERVWERVRFEYEYGETFAAMAVTPSTSDETVNTLADPPVANGDGSITVTVTGGLGPYSLEINGIGVVATGVSPLTYSGLAGATDYEIKVTDSIGSVSPSSGWTTVHVYREAFSVNLNRSATLSIAFTPWSRTISIPQYDDATLLGSLTSVELIQTDATARSTAQIENTSGTAGTAVTTVDLSLGVEYPAATVIGSDVITITPLFSNVLAAYDGVADYAGASGVSNARRTTIKTTSYTAAITPTSDFVGSGNVLLTITGGEAASVAGISPYLLAVNPDLGATITVRYTVTGARE